MGDALAVALLEARGFSAEDFAFTHPGGALGRRLLLKVSDIMHSNQELPSVKDTALLKQALIEITQKGLGITTVLDEQGHLAGVFTDGDLRRVIEQQIDIHSTPIKKLMTLNPLSIQEEMLAAEALGLMEKKSITALVVVDNTQTPVGILHMHDILRAGII